MPIELIDKIKPKNGGKFPMVDAEDVFMPDGTRLSELPDQIEDLQREVIIETTTEINIYNPNLQTDETISPHYYFDGYPYSDASLDDKYNATALIEVEPDTTYAIALIPDFIYTLPWADCPQGLFFYDENEVYIGKPSDATSNIFTTPSNAKYIRFNYSLVRSIKLGIVNERCVIVKGDSVPNRYIPYGEIEIKKTKLKDEVVGLMAEVNEHTQILKEKVYIEPMCIYENARCYPVESTGKFFCIKDDNLYVSVYSLEAGKTYCFNADTPHAAYNVSYVLTEEALYSMPESGFNTGVTYIHVNKESAEYGRFQHKVTPNKNCYIYIQLINEESSVIFDYLNPYENVYTNGTIAKIEAEVNSLKRFAYFIANENEIMVSKKYSNDMDIQFLLKRKGGNELFDFYKIYKFANADDVPKVHDVTDITPFLSGGGDWHSPFKVKAVNNVDGTQIDNDYFTGGNHQYNNSGSGSTATARSVSVEFIIDGIKMASGTGHANEIVMKWVNNVQGYNTTKEDGTGREILQERHTMTLKDGIFHTYVELAPLEDVICELWYGFQMFTTPYDTVQYIDGENRTPCNVSGNSNSGDNAASKVRFTNSTEDICEIKANTFYDLGKRNHSTGDRGIFTTDYGKAYYSIINTPLSMVGGTVYGLEGEYIFRSGSF